jgi:glycosyltransferase involved in cell wall biosynthesis
VKISFITTFLNEEKTILQLLKSLLNQTLLPDEIILVDGGSTDKTLSIISNLHFPISKKRVKVIIKKGNRSVGRNVAIRNAIGEIIVCSDAGNILDKKWIENITRPFTDGKIDVVAGYYKGKPDNIFQKCLIPYVLVMPDRVNQQNFLPATRSIAFKKTVWEKVGKFDEKLSHNEDYVFANNLKSSGANIIFAKNAIVNWIPRTTLKQTYIMFYRFAYGDIEAGIYRPKVIILFVRYFIFLIIFILFVITGLNYLLLIMCALILMYILWAIVKNYKYVRNPRGFYILPTIQIIADMSVIEGSIRGFLK